MENEVKLFTAIAELQKSVAEIKAGINVVANQHQNSEQKFERGVTRLDDLAERLRMVEAKIEKHIGYFGVISAGLLACAGAIGVFF